MNVRGLELFAMLNEIGLGVMAKTNNVQQPWISASPIKGPVYLNPPDAVVHAPPIPSTPPLLGPPTPPIMGSTKREEPRSTTGESLPFIQQAYKQLDGKDYAGARATLTQAIKADGNFAPAYSYRGFAWYLEGSTKETRDDPQGALIAYRQAFPDLDTAIQLDPSYAPVRRHRGNTIVGGIQSSKSSWQTNK
jgi:tetratricopeptide (TPR) repeat protein